MKIFDVMKKKESIFLSIMSSFLFSIVYIDLQLTADLVIWLKTISTLNLATLIIFIIMFGITMAYQVYVIQQQKICNTNKKGMLPSSFSTFGIFAVSQCAACAPLGLLIIPSSILLTLSEYGYLVNTIGILLMLFAINYLGGFRK